MLLHVHALEHRAHRARHRVVARGDALRAHSVIALVKALADRLAALGLGGRNVVEDELAEQVRRAVWAIGTQPFLKLVDASAVGAIGRDRALERRAKVVKAVRRAVLAQQLGGLVRLGGVHG